MTLSILSNNVMSFIPGIVIHLRVPPKSKSSLSWGEDRHVGQLLSWIQPGQSSFFAVGRACIELIFYTTSYHSVVTGKACFPIRAVRLWEWLGIVKDFCGVSKNISFLLHSVITIVVFIFLL